MFSMIWSNKIKGSFLSSSCCRESGDGKGLRMLITLENGKSEALVIKPLLKNVKPIFLLDQTNQPNHQKDQFFCYLKSCHLCHKTLTLDKEVYIYRGDLGFCSEQCRDRQIFIDEKKEYEVSSQKILASFRQRQRGSGRCEQRRQLMSPSQENRVILFL